MKLIPQPCFFCPRSCYHAHHSIFKRCKEICEKCPSFQYYRRGVLLEKIIPHNDYVKIKKNELDKSN